VAVDGDPNRRRPLPDYEQPPAPGDDYLWTPGYWAYASMGYYWVPGVWVQAPYEGALWTPGYWGFRTAATAFTAVTGVRTSASTAASTTGSAMWASATRAATGTSGHFFYNRTVNNINGGDP
jgi:hypothetical protein